MIISQNLDSAVVVGVSVFVLTIIVSLIVRAILGRNSSTRGIESLNSYAPARIETDTKSSTVRQNALDAVGKFLIPKSYELSMRSRLVATGKQDEKSYKALVRRKIVAAVSLLGWGLLTQASRGLSGVLISLGLGVVGFFLPDLLTYNTGEKRSKEIERALPDAIDILKLCVESGLSFQAALNQVAQITKGPLAQEFARVLRQMQLGQPMMDSLNDMAKRNDVPDLIRFVSVMSQAEKLGIPISSVLKEQSLEMRSKRRDRARELAQKVPVKILGPVMLCFLPGIFVVVIGPAVVSIVRAFSQM